MNGIYINHLMYADDINVNVEVYSLRSPWVQQALQFSPLVLELSLIRSHLLLGELSTFSAANVIHNIPVFVPPGTHQCWVDSGSMVWKVLPNTSTHQLTSVIFGNWLIYHVLPLVTIDTIYYWLHRQCALCRSYSSLENWQMIGR